MKILTTVLLSALLLAALLPGTARAAEPFKGPFMVADGGNFYMVNPGGDAFKLTVRFKPYMPHAAENPLLVRVFDPEERRLVRYEFFHPKQKKGQWMEKTFDVPARGPGVYLVSVVGLTAFVEVSTDPQLTFGYYGHSQHFKARDDQFADSYVYLPKGLKGMPVRVRGTLDSMTLTDEAGKQVLNLKGKNPRGKVSFPGTGGQIWRWSIKGRSYAEVNTDGTPLILCPDRETAQAIKGSIDILDDGTICFHKFQVRAWELLKTYKAMNADAYKVDFVDLETVADELLKQPQRNRLLFERYGILGNVKAACHEQNLDPSSPWFGAFHIWKDKAGKPRTDNPLTDYKRNGVSSFAMYADNLAMLVDTDQPWNPYHGNQALLNRAIVASLMDLMLVRESEIASPGSSNYYGGGRAFAFADEYTSAFPHIIDEVPAEVKDVWTEGLGRIVDRYLISHVNTHNQWTFIPVGIWAYYKGTGDEFYRKQTERHIRWMLQRTQWSAGQMPAGYFREAGGPDGTYNGITLHNLAWLYHEMGRPENLHDAMKRNYDLFNHTIAPEPDGTRLGACDYGCRTPGDWTSPQYNAGWLMMAGAMPEAGVHAGHGWLNYPPAENEQQAEQYREQFRKRTLRYNPEDIADRQPGNAGRIAWGYHISYRIWKHYTETVQHGKLPVLTDESFSKNFGDEFFAVRRPAYYALVYAGSSRVTWQKQPSDPNAQWPRNGGGLCMVWSPGFGSSILGKNWNTYSAHEIVGTLDDKTLWSDYFKVKPTWNAREASLAVEVPMRDVPVVYTRNYTFGDDMIVCRTTMSAERAVRFTTLDECFPYPLEAKPKAIEVTWIDADGKATDGPTAHGFMMDAGGAEVHLVVFDAPRTCRAGKYTSTDHYKDERSWNRVLTGLPATWTAGQKRTVGFAIAPVKRDAVQQTVAKMRRALADK